MNRNEHLKNRKRWFELRNRIKNISSLDFLEEFKDALREKLSLELSKGEDSLRAYWSETSR